jgi:allantoicase
MTSSCSEKVHRWRFMWQLEERSSAVDGFFVRGEGTGTWSGAWEWSRTKREGEAMEMVISLGRTGGVEGDEAVDAEGRG